MKQKASAWYYVAYQPQDIAHTDSNSADTMQEKQMQYLSFPWLIDDVMLEIIKERHSTKYASSTVVSEVSQSLLAFYEEERDSFLESFRQRIRIKSLVSTFLAEGNYLDYRSSLALFGSSANLLFRWDSDVDLCVVNQAVISQKETLTREQQLAVLNRLRPCMKNIFHYNRLVESARVPVSLQKC